MSIWLNTVMFVSRVFDIMIHLHKYMINENIYIYIYSICISTSDIRIS